MRSCLLLTVFMLLFAIISCDKNNSGQGQGDNESNDSVSLNDSDQINVDPKITNKDTFEGEQTWNGVLPTGQVKCYNNSKEINCPKEGYPFYGQDAQFNQYKTRSFTKASGVVTDDVTNIKWQESYMSKLTWTQAYNYCNTLSVNNRKWRLPTPHELKSLINYGLFDSTKGGPWHPATTFPCNIDSGQNLIPTGCKVTMTNDWYWSSSRVQNDGMAWVVYMYDGYLEFTKKENLYSVKCVATN